MRRARLLPALAALVVVAAACGGDTASTTTEGTTTSVATTTPVATATGAPSTTVVETTVAARTFTGIDGVETAVDDTSRIVSLNGDITEVIYELGLGESVVAVDVTTTYPEEAAALIDRGDTVGLSMQLAPEAVLRFDPTLVIGDQQVAPQEVIDQLRDAGVPVVIIETQVTLDGAATKIGQIAEILGVPDEGAELAGRVAAEVEAARALIPEEAESPSVAYVYVRGPETIFLFGAGTQTQAMIEGAGAVDAGAGSGVGGLAPLTPEALIAAAPDVIVLPELGLQALGGLDALLAIPGVSDTPAAANEEFLVYDEAYFFNLGPRVGQALAEFIGDLYSLTG
ncbi:MAG TPA: ABC transporter substrate-binding protein [Acidimicrobiia bacterium]|jgi:iron complex transport system substrate-binding protein